MLNKFMAALSHDSTTNSTNNTAHHGSSSLSTVRKPGWNNSSSSASPTSAPPKKPSRGTAPTNVTQTLENRLRTSRLECEQLKIKLSTVQKDHEMLQYQKKENENLKLSLNKMQNSMSHLKRMQKTEEEFTKWINQLAVENKTLKSMVENLEDQLRKVRDEAEREKAQSTERFQRLQSQNSDIISLNESSRTHYENFVQYIASHVVQGSIEQRSLQQETKRLTDRVTSLEEQCVYLRNCCHQFTTSPGLPPRNSQRRDSSSSSPGRTSSPFIPSPCPREDVSGDVFRGADSRVYNVARRRTMKISGHPQYDMSNRNYRRKYNSRHHQTSVETGATQFPQTCEQWPCGAAGNGSSDLRLASDRISCIHHHIPFTYTMSPISSLTSTSSIPSLQCSLPTNASSFETSSSASSSTSYMNRLKMKRKLIPRYQNVVLHHSPKMGAPAQPAVASDSLLKHIYPSNNISSVEPSCEYPCGTEYAVMEPHSSVQQRDCKTHLEYMPSDSLPPEILPNKKRLVKTLPSLLNENDFGAVQCARTHKFREIPFTPAFVRKSAEQMIHFHYPCPPLPSRTIHQNKDDGYSSMSCEGNCKVPNLLEGQSLLRDEIHSDCAKAFKADEEVTMSSNEAREDVDKSRNPMCISELVAGKVLNNYNGCRHSVNVYRDLKRRYFHRRINHFTHRNCDVELLQEHYDSRLRRMKYHNLTENVYSDSELYVTNRFHITSSPDLTPLSNSVTSPKEEHPLESLEKPATANSHILITSTNTQMAIERHGISNLSNDQLIQKEKVSMTGLAKSRIPIRCLKNKSQMKSHKWYAPRAKINVLQSVSVDRKPETQSDSDMTTAIVSTNNSLAGKSADFQLNSVSQQSPQRVDSNCGLVNSDDLYIDDDDFHSSNLYLASVDDPSTQDFPYTSYNSHSHFHPLRDSQMYHLPIFLDPLECHCHATPVCTKPNLSHVRNHSHPVDTFFLAERVL